MTRDQDREAGQHDDQHDGGGAAAADPESLGYSRALDELDEILRELEGSDVDVDRLAERVARAAELITVCRGRISDARLRIDGVIADLDAASDLGSADDSPAS